MVKLSFSCTLLMPLLRALTSQGEVTVRLEKEGRIINGQGADTDILLASAKAYVNALTIMRNPGRLHPS